MFSQNWHKNHCNKHLELITAVHQAGDLHLKGIATLAHDTHVENFLSNETNKQSISLADGFSFKSTECNWKTWENNFHENKYVPFLKLHGSVNWKKIHRHENNRCPETIGIKIAGTGRTSPWPNGPSEPEGWSINFDGRPLLLIGTFNKPAMYAEPMLLEVHYRFRKILKDTNTLVVCGYSFGDKAINTQLVSWWNAFDRSLVVIDPCCKSQIQRTARYAARQFLGDPPETIPELQPRPQPQGTKFVDKKMENVCTDELMDKLRNQ